MDRPSRGQLKPSLGVFDATAVGIGAIIGAGIFAVTGITAGLAGPDVIIGRLVLGARMNLSESRTPF